MSQTTKSSKGSLLYDPKVRGIFFQIVTVALLVAFVWIIMRNTAANLEKQNIASGLGFMDNEAGFGLVQTLGTYLMSYSETSSYFDAFMVGLINTIFLAFLGIILATIFGFIIGVARLSTNWVIRSLATVYIEVIRNIPLLLQIFFWYFAVLRALPGKRDSASFMDSVFLNVTGLYGPAPQPQPGFNLTIVALIVGIIGTILVKRWATKRQEATGEQFPVLLTGLGLIIGLPILVFLISGMPMDFDYPVESRFGLKGGAVIIPEFMALLLALSIYTASFIAEIVRAGILAVSHGQTEASHALGLRNGPTLRLVVIPQAMRVIIPPLTSQYLNLTKNSSLAAAIAYPELVSVFGGTVLNQTGQAVEVILLTMAVYLTISLLTSAFMNWYNERMKLVER